MKIDPITMEIVRNLVISLTEEMGVLLQKAAHSPNIKERLDASCALFDSQNRLIAQAEHIPVHLGSMPEALFAIQKTLNISSINEGDQFLVNDPHQGGTHLPDLTVVKPVFYDNLLVGWTVCKAHHSDVGGMTPGSMPAMSKDIFQEGLIIPPVKIVSRGQIVNDILNILLANTRTPSERLGDIMAQISANDKGSTRFKAILKKYSLPFFQSFTEQLIDYSHKRVLQKLKSFKLGNYSATDSLEMDSISRKELKIQCSAVIKPDKIELDFTGSAYQTEGNLNAPFAVTKSAVYYVFRCLTDPEIPPNHGSYLPLKIKAPKASVCNPETGKAVVAGNVETSQRIVELLFTLFEKALPGKSPAQSQGTMNNITFGGKNYDGTPFTYYETIGGGEGAWNFRNGQDGIHVNMTNTANTPAEVLETKYPLKVLEYSLRLSSGGEGKFHGGRGIIRKIEILNDNITVEIISESRIKAPKGRKGGKAGKVGVNSFIRNGKRHKLPSKVTVTLQKGDILEIKTPGGGGYGISRPDFRQYPHNLNQA